MKNKASQIAVLAVVITLIWSMFNIRLWKDGDNRRQVIDSDVVHYYSYLPAYFIHDDLTFKFVDSDTTNYRKESKFWPLPTKDGEGYVVKMTMGLSFMYAPFFLGAHKYALAHDNYEASGFSLPYEFMLVLSSIFYLSIGFIFLRKLLLQFFSDWITTWVILIIFIGTNLYYYGSTEPCMSHAYSFSLFSILFYNVVKWREEPNYKNLIFGALAFGLITLIRPVNFLVIIPLLLYNYQKGIWQWHLKKWKHLLLFMLIASLVCLPQLLYWHFITGEWLYNSYIDEGFYFLNPHIIDGLFSYRKGWLLYTPIMIFSLVGIYFLWKTKNKFALGITIYTPIHIYVIFSWWCWWYGGSFGCRPMIETYALLAIPLASFLSEMYNRFKLKFVIAFLPVCLFLISLNLVQTAQKRRGVIHWDAMTKEAYWYNFMQVEDAGGVWNYFSPPNYEAASKGLSEDLSKKSD